MALQQIERSYELQFSVGAAQPGVLVEVPVIASDVRVGHVNYAHMQRLSFLLIFGSAILSAANPFAGRWDMTVITPAATYPGWIELVEKDGAPQVRMQPRGGSVHPVANVRMEGSHLILVISPASGDHPELLWDLTVSGSHISGVQKRGDATAGDLKGVRAPELKRNAPKAWTAPEPLFNGKDLTGWEPDNPAANHWVAQDGAILNQTHGANLKSTRKFDDFKLHIEFNCPEGGNSGIYLRGRYEVQVEYEPAGTEDRFHGMGAVYGMVPTAVDVPRTPGKWESFDITLVGRNVTIVRNGIQIVDNQEIAGITGGALDSNEGEPGPFYFQGDHTGGMMYRNITISVPKR